MIKVYIFISFKLDDKYREFIYVRINLTGEVGCELDRNYFLKFIIFSYIEVYVVLIWYVV